MEVDLRSVERTVSFVDYILDSLFFQCFLQAVGCQFPIFFRPHGIFRTGRQFYMIREPEQFIYIIDKIDYADNFILDLFLQHKNVSIVLGKCSYPHQAVKGAGQLMPVYLPQFAHTNGKVSVAVQFPFIYQHRTGTVHGFNRIIPVVDLCKIHVVLIMIPMSGSVPQIFIQNQRRFNFLIAPLNMSFPPERFQFVADYHASGHKEGESRPLIIKCEQIHFLADLSVISLLCLFDHV